MTLIIDSWRDLRAHSGRSLMSAISLFIAVLAIVGVSVYGSIARDSIVATDEQSFGRPVTASGQVGFGELAHDQFESFATALDHRIGQSHNGEWALLIPTTGAIVISAAADRANTIDGTTAIGGNLLGVKRIPIIKGAWFNTNGLETYPPKVVLNETAAEQVGGIGTSLIAGREVNNKEIHLRVGGVIDDGNPEAQAYLTLESILNFDPQFADQSYAELLLHAPSTDLDGIRASLEMAVRDSNIEFTGALNPDGGTESSDGLMRYDNAESLGFGLETVRLGFFAATAITLIVAIMGMANIGLASIRERQRELSVRLAVGFSRRRIFLLILGSNAVLGVLVATTAITVAYLVVAGVIPGLSVLPLVNQPDFPWGSAVLALGVSFVATFFGALAPAIAASRIEIATALR